MLFLALVALAAAAVAAATAEPANLPRSIAYFVTIRSFMASTCRQDLAGTPQFSLYCPDDAELRSLVANGSLSGHPDFERKVLPTYNSISGPPFPYNTTYGQDRLPLVYLNVNNITRPPVFPVVTSLLRAESTGLFKMQYCDATTNLDPTRCDSDQVAGNLERSVKDRDSFSTWYTDSPKFNRRLGYELELELTNALARKYSYDAKNEPYGLYSPIDQLGLLDKAFPLSPYEASGFTDTAKCDVFGPECFRGKYWFTTEIHTFFQYRGDEAFLFKGDDDVYVFINNRLAINLGGEHNAISRNISLSQYVGELDLVEGQIYAFDMFHCERQTKGSNYAMETTLTQACNVANASPEDSSELIDWKYTAYQPAEWFFLSGQGYGYEADGVAYLMKPDIPNAVSYLFNRRSQNLGSGFALEFAFRMSGGGGHGFSLLIHNRGLENLNGGATGPNLGVKNLAKSVAVVFDACADFPQCAGSRMELRMHYDANGLTNNVSNQTKRVYDANVNQKWATDNALHVVKVYYYATPDWLEVYVDDSLRLVERGFNLQQVLGSRDGYIGFASSSSTQGSQMQVEVSQIVMRTVSVDYSRTLRNQSKPIAAAGGGAFVADGWSKATFQISTSDSCNTRYTSGGLGKFAQGRLVLTSNPHYNATARRRLQDAPSVAAQVTDELDGTYSLAFSTTVPGEYDLYLGFGPGCGPWNGTAYPPSNSSSNGTDCWTFSLVNATTASEFITVAPTSPPSSGEDAFDWEVFKWVMIGLGITLCCCGFWILVLVRVYRKKWREDKKFVKPGEIALIEKHVDYSSNPTGIQMAMFGKKVQESKQEIEKLRARDPVQDDLRTLEYKKEVYDLNKTLKDQVNVMKRRKQEAADMGVTAKSSMPEHDKSERRISFKPQRTQASELVAFSSLVDEDEEEEEAPRPKPSLAAKRASLQPLATGGSSYRDDEEDLTVWEEERVSKMAPPPPPPPHEDSDEEEVYSPPPPPQFERSPRRMSVGESDMSFIEVADEVPNNNRRKKREFQS